MLRILAATPAYGWVWVSAAEGDDTPYPVVQFAVVDDAGATQVLPIIVKDGRAVLAVEDGILELVADPILDTPELPDGDDA